MLRLPLPRKLRLQRMQRPRSKLRSPEKLPSPVSEETAPTVTIRSSDNGDVIEEYREGGRVYMVRITPVRGVPYYLYDDDRNGRMDRTDADKASVSPVYWTIYEWD